jgi:hypothetical protein
MPVEASGVYPDQATFAGFPSYCHLAFHTITAMNGHPYYRYYQISDSLNYYLDVEAFMTWMDTIVG